MTNVSVEPVASFSVRRLTVPVPGHAVRPAANTHIGGSGGQRLVHRRSTQHPVRQLRNTRGACCGSTPPTVR